MELTSSGLLQVPDRLHLRQQHRAARRRGVPLQPQAQQDVRRLQLPAERALGPRGDPPQDALQGRSSVRARGSGAGRPLQGETGRTQTSLSFFNQSPDLIQPELFFFSTLLLIYSVHEIILI